MIIDNSADFLGRRVKIYLNDYYVIGKLVKIEPDGYILKGTESFEEDAETYYFFVPKKSIQYVSLSETQLYPEDDSDEDDDDELSGYGLSL